MAIKSSIVLGLGYGDEGKGLITDFLTKNSENPLIIRFNGGHQAGHTVSCKDGTTHVFSHFGSGTLRNAPSYWSRYCAFSPAYLLYEYDSLPINPILFIDKLCSVTTHYDVLFNRCLEATRGQKRLGSCGMGVGATFQRHLDKGIALFPSDLLNNNSLKNKLGRIRDYYKTKFLKEINFRFADYNHDEEDQKFFSYVEEIQELILKGNLSIVNESEILNRKEWKSFIFEGAQGILLDKQLGQIPYVTQSRTVSKNAIDMLTRYQRHIDIDIYYITRSYLTRHGGGSFQEFPSDYQLRNTITETNIDNPFQGRFRKGFLNIDLLNYALTCDAEYSKFAKKNFVVTCIDQLPSDKIIYTSQNKILSANFRLLPKALNFTFSKVIFCNSPYSEDIIV